jgi:hypothetical protein
MDDILKKVNEKYLDEILGMLPIHRFLLMLIAFPPAILLLPQHPFNGVLLSYARITPVDVFNLSGGLAWQMSWAQWCIVLVVTFCVVMLASTIQKLIVFGLSRSKHKTPFLNKIAESATTILQEKTDLKPLLESLDKNLEARKKLLLRQIRLGETLVSIAALLLVFVSKWDQLDLTTFLTCLLLGVLAQVSAHRYYIAKVAPLFLIGAILRGQFADVEEGFFL